MDHMHAISRPCTALRFITVTLHTCSSHAPLAHHCRSTTARSRSPSSLFMFQKHCRSPLPRLLQLCVLLGAIVALEFVVNSARNHCMNCTDQAHRTRSSSTPYTHVVRFMTLNAFIRPIAVGMRDYKDARLHDLLQHLHSFDLICFQELFTSSGNRKSSFLRKLAHHYGLTHHVSSPTPGLRDLFSFPPNIIDGGLVIASRFDIVQTDYLTYSQASIQSIDFIVAKGVLYARIALPMPHSSHCFIHVFTTHMQADNGLHVHFASTRHSQLQQLAQFVAHKTSDHPSAPIVLAGDFNVDARRDSPNVSSSEEYLNMMNVLHNVRHASPLRDILYEANGNMHPVTGAGGLDGATQKNERLDYIFFSAGDRSERRSPCEVTDIPSSVRVQPWKIAGRPYRTLSDHYAVVANFSVAPTNNQNSNP